MVKQCLQIIIQYGCIVFSTFSRLQRIAYLSSNFVPFDMKRLLTPVLDLLTLLFIVMMHYHVRDFRVIPEPWHLAGVLFLLFGLLLLAGSFFIFLKYKTPMSYTRSSHLITSGVFALSRNPIYLGKALLMAGLAVITAHLFSLLAVAAYILLYHVLVIPMEERLLHETFGRSYREYQKKVRRWL